MKNKPLILGHRGYRAKFPENTMLAFAKAYGYGADGIECDVQKTMDGAYIIFHDDELSRITEFNGSVSGTSYDVIKKLDAGSGERIPSIDEFLDSLPRDKFINIELKEETLAPADSYLIMKMLQERNLKENILISSFKHELLPPFKKNGYKTGLLFESADFSKGVLDIFFKVLRHRPWSVNLPVKIFTPLLTPMLKLFIFTMKLPGIKIIFWTVNSMEQYDSVKSYAFCVITDNVELMVNL